MYTRNMLEVGLATGMTTAPSGRYKHIWISEKKTKMNNNAPNKLPATKVPGEDFTMRDKCSNVQAHTLTGFYCVVIFSRTRSSCRPEFAGLWAFIQ